MIIHYFYTSFSFIEKNGIHLLITYFQFQKLYFTCFIEYNLKKNQLVRIYLFITYFQFTFSIDNQWKTFLFYI